MSWDMIGLFHPLLCTEMGRAVCSHCVREWDQTEVFVLSHGPQYCVKL